MLNGNDPVIIFQFSKNVDPEFVGPQQQSFIAGIPIVSSIPTLIDQPPIPIYFSQAQTGIYITSEEKSVEIETDTETKTNSEAPNINQKAIMSSVTINLTGKKDSIGIALISAMIDVLYDKVTAKEYAISYLHGATTIFRGVLQSYAVTQERNSDLVTIKIELSKGTKSPTKALAPLSVPGSEGGIPGPA